MADDDWTYTEEHVSHESIEALQRLLSLKAREGFVLEYDEAVHGGEG